MVITMCLFKKKKSKVKITNNRYKEGEMVNFRYKGEVSPGLIYAIKLDEDNKVIYDVQIGGECPAIIYDVKEEEIFARRK